MTTKLAVTDEQLGAFSRREHELFRRVREGTLPFESVMSALQGIIEGNFNAAPMSSGRFIDCDRRPYCPNSYQLKLHQPGGQMEFDPSKIELYQTQSQKVGQEITPIELLRRVECARLMNACVLDHLLQHPTLIPESWKRDDAGRTRYILFMNTEYRDVISDERRVRCLYWDDGQWHWEGRWVVAEVDDRHWVAMYAS